MKLTESQLRRIIREALKPKSLPPNWRIKIAAGDSPAAGIHSFKVMILNSDNSVVGHLGANRHWSGDVCTEGVYEVRSSDVEGGFGPLVYDIAIEWASMNGQGLMPDRGYVSTAAARVWEKYLAMRPDVQAHPNPPGKCEGEEHRAGAGEWYYHRYTKEESIIPMLAKSGQLEIYYDGYREDIKLYM